MSATQVVKVTNGTVGVVHTATAGRTLCGRDAAPMLTLSDMAPWERMGWDAASKGACMRCDAKLAKLPRVAPIVVDSSPAGIFAAMMRANASESAAPQTRLYGLLSDYLRRTLAAEYGTVAAEHVYTAIMSSGEASDDVIAYGLESVQYGRTENVTMADLSVGDTVSTDVGPVLLTSDRAARVLSGRVQFIGRILSTESVAPECLWILRSNVSAGQAVDYWVCQGIDRRPMVRYAV